MQNKIIKAGDLLNEKGELIECGYSTKLIKDYDRSKIKAGKLRIKEWDYYLIYNDKFGVALTVDDNSYMGLNSVSFLDFDKKQEITKSPMRFMTKGTTNLPKTSKTGDVLSESKNYKFSFKIKGKKRLLEVWLKNFKKHDDRNIKFELTTLKMDIGIGYVSMRIQT